MGTDNYSPPTREEVIKLWADIMRNPDSDLKDRLKVSEYIAKATGALEPLPVNNDESESEYLINMSLSDRLEMVDTMIEDFISRKNTKKE